MKRNKQKAKKKAKKRPSGGNRRTEYLKLIRKLQKYSARTKFTPGNSKTLAYISRNIRTGKLPLTQRQMLEFRKHKKNFTSKNKSKTLKNIVNQSGKGILSALIIPAISALTSLFSGGK